MHAIQCQNLHRRLKCSRVVYGIRPGVGLMLLASLAFLGTIGCSSTQIRSFRNPQYRLAEPARSMTVVVVDDRRFVRSTFEQQLATRLQEAGVNAAVSFEFLTLNELEGDKEQLRRKFEARRTESVLFTRLTEKRDNYVNPRFGGIDFYHSGLTWMDVDNARLDRSGTGQDILSTFRLESNVYRVSDGALIWVGYTDTVLNETTDRLSRIRTITRAIVKQMARDGVIP